MKYIGKIIDGKDVNIAPNSPNKHVVITGLSGSGKSVRITDIERHILNEGGTVIALDVNGTHVETDNSGYHHISAQKDGLSANLLDMTLVNEEKETLSNLVDYIMETICPRQLRGACQRACVRKAVEFALHNRNQFSSEMEAIAHGLKKQKGTVALAAYNHLCPILEGNIFRDSRKKFIGNAINIIDLKGLNPKTQGRVIEILLNVLWRKMRIEGCRKERFTLILDEFQNLDFQQGSILFQMLTEIRKYGVNLVLATQTLTIFSRKELAIVNQAATKLFFRQNSTDLKKVAEMIEPERYEKWMQTLSRLRIGQAVAVGELEIGGRQLQQPVITYSSYPESDSLRFKVLSENN